MDKQSAGAIWCVSDEVKGGRRYFDQAVLSAKSFRQHNPHLGTAIFSADPTLTDDVFDHHFSVYQNDDERAWTMRYLDEWSPTKRITNLKVLCSVRSPFYKTLHLDADTYVVGDVSEIFDELDEYSILFTVSDAVKRDDRGRNVGCTQLTVPNKANSGVYAFRQDEQARYIMGEQWLDIVETRGIGEQAVQSIYMREPDKYMPGVKWKYLDNVIYNAQRRMWRSMKAYGLWDEAKILHYNGHEAFLRLHNGEITKDDLLDLPNVRSCDPAWIEVPPRKPMNEMTQSSSDESSNL